LPTVSRVGRNAWQALLRLRESGLLRQIKPGLSLAYLPNGEFEWVAQDAPGRWLDCASDGVWLPADALAAEARAMLELYLPLCEPSLSDGYVVGHLGQSMDGFIANQHGDSYYVTGPENILHLHRMRALSDAVIVGAGTILHDDPALTTRHAEGPNPVRVILDPSRRLSHERQVFSDAQAQTWLVCDIAKSEPRQHGCADVLGVPCINGGFDLDALLRNLRQRGVQSVFVEGGGVAVSQFLHAQLLDRLQLAVAPLIIGSGRAGISLPGRERLVDCLRPDCRVFRMGQDLLFDFDPRQPAQPMRSETAPLERIY
jgi:riboflavin-specific deaminase-like protein